MYFRSYKSLGLVFVALLATTTACLNKSKSLRQSTSQPSPAPNQNSFQNQSNHLTQAAADQKPVYVAIGGWNSCLQDPRIPSGASPYGMNMNKEFSRLIAYMDQRTPGVPTKSLMACHTANTNQVRYVSSAAPSTMIIGTHEQLYSAIASFAQTSQSPIILLGHSYGGDYVMQAASVLPATVNIAQLFTIDGISPVNCPANVFVQHATSKLSSLFGKSTVEPQYGLGCTQSPREFTIEQRAAIRSRVGWWQNYFQNDLLAILKSDSIPEACNQSVHHINLKSAINGHIAMGMYDKLWSDITNRIIQPTPSQCVDNRL